jgi:hypothetical protein
MKKIDNYFADNTPGGGKMSQSRFGMNQAPAGKHPAPSKTSGAPAQTSAAATKTSHAAAKISAAAARTRHAALKTRGVNAFHCPSAEKKGGRCVRMILMFRLKEIYFFS